MKALAIWLAIAAVVSGTGAGAYHAFLESNPRLILVIADSSFEMRDALRATKAKLEALGEERYARYALYTEKARMHGWASSLEPARLNAYAPRSFTRLFEGTMGPEFEEADRVVFITNAPDASLTDAPGHWQILRTRG